jgi:predicted secreted hydrolase
MSRIIIIIVIAVCATAIGIFWSQQENSRPDIVSADAEFLPLESTDLNQYARAINPYVWSFPADYGAHPDYQTEWWYYTGNLATEDGRRFGFQFTIFRRAIAPETVESDSEWRTNQLYMAHFTVTDVENEHFFQSQRFSRGSAGLAGATTDPRYRVWLEDWQVVAEDEAALFTTISAETSEVALRLNLEQIKPPALQGDQGLSPKSAVPGNASYYYSLSRLLTSGTITLDDVVYPVDGTTWMDHEFSTSALGESAQGWDWFGLHLDNNRELMIGQIRLPDGDVEPAFGGLLVNADGSTRYLAADDFSITALDTWLSPNTGTEYPAGWEIVIDIGEARPLTLRLTPLIDNQELIEGAIVYWEGAVQITGDVTGYGYAELAGYQGTMRGRF